MTQKRYIVKLTCEERSQLEVMLKRGKHSAAVLTKARILLKADADHPDGGWTDAAICEALSVQKNRAEVVRKCFVEEGLQGVLTRKKRETPSVPRIFDGEKEARLITLACSHPPEGYAQWTLRLLADKIVELGIVESVSHSTVGLALKKTPSNRISENNGLFRRRKTPHS